MIIQNPITIFDRISIPSSVTNLAVSIQDQNNKVNTPRKFQKTQGINIDEDIGVIQFKLDLCQRMGCEQSKLDYTLFSCPQGSEPHTDMLDPEKYGVMTYIVPIIMETDATFFTETECIDLEVGYPYSFNHTLLHSLEVKFENPTVLVMASILQ